MSKYTRRTIATAAAAALALAGCGGSERGSATDTTKAGGGTGGSTAPGGSGGGGKGFDKASAYIGVALPQKTSENWVLAEQLFKDGLKSAGYTKYDVQFANGGVSEQQNQIAAMVTKGAKVIIVGAIDGSQLGTQLKQAKDAGATIIAYDRLLKNTDAVDYYVAYDNRKVGQLQGEALLKGLKEKMGAGPYNVELLAGSPDDANAQVFFDGAMDKIKAEFDKSLKIVSGQKDFSQCITQGWKAENAQKRMDTILAGFYKDKELHGILSPNDTLARAALTSVKQAGKKNPVVTGQDSEKESVKLIISGEQYSTINKDTRKLVKETISMIDSLQKGDKAKVTDEKQYNNGVKTVPANLLEPLIVTKTNVKEAYADDPILKDIIAGA